jgi:hypothetical protein
MEAAWQNNWPSHPSGIATLQEDPGSGRIELHSGRLVHLGQVCLAPKFEQSREAV